LLAAYAITLLDRFYPCEMSRVTADIVFIIDASMAFNESTKAAIYNFIVKYLEPFGGPQFGPNGVQAAMIAYQADVVAKINLKDTSNFDDFKNLLYRKLPSGTGSNRGIDNALKATLTDIFNPANGYRETAPHVAILFALDCHTGVDPADQAKLLRQKAEFFVVAIHPPTVNAKELLDLAGDTDHIFQLTTAIEGGLPSFMSVISWQFTCDAWSGSFIVNFNDDNTPWDPAYAIAGSPQRLDKIQEFYQKLSQVYSQSALHASVIDVINFQQAGANTKILSNVIFDGYTRQLLKSTVTAAITPAVTTQRWTMLDVQEVAPRPLVY